MTTTGPVRRVPAPRPALRKAQDAELHPAAGPSAAVGAATGETDHAGQLGASADEGAATPAARTPGQSRSAAAAAFWEALQSDATAALQREGGSTTGKSGKPGKSGTSAKKSKPTKKKFQGATSDVLRTDRPDHDLLLGKQVSMEVRVPKRLRKAAAEQAERHGTSLDHVVTGLLAGWVDGS